MAVRILTDLQLNIEKNTRFLQQMQARHYAQGAENYLTVLLEADFASDKKNKKMIDHWFEAWADTGVTLDTDDGEITIQVLDDQGRFNLNMLAGQGEHKEELKILERLLVGQGIDAQLASRLQDWIDENTDALPAGAEDDFYLLLDQPYRTSNTRPVIGVRTAIDADTGTG